MIYLSKQRFMKYYIPTSSLNLDNILQAECISPSSFYSERETGYKSFEVIQELKGINRIVLFQYPVHFTIDDPNRYNYPLLIEVEDDCQLQVNFLQSESNGIYTYSKTLYLTPTNCRLFFFSDKAYRLTTINTRNNKSIKYYEKYLIFPTTAGLKLKEMPPVNIEERGCLDDNTETQNDRKKGLLYAYLLGQKLSISPELAHQKKLTQEIYDMISGIMANLSMSEMYKKKLNNLMDDYKSVDLFEKKYRMQLQTNLQAYLDSYKIKISEYMEMQKGLGLWDKDYRQLSKKWGCDTLPLMSELTYRDDFKRLGEIVERRTEQSIANYRKTLPHPSLSAIHNNNQIIIKGLPLLTIAVNYVINNKLTAEKLSAHRADHCLGMINEIKEHYIRTYGENMWNEKIRTYVNNLYSHIQNIETPFNLHSIEQKELLAIAAFLLRGNDIDNYLTYLKMKEISDYGYPLMLWGALCGYMEMNKEVLSDVLNTEYYEEIYRCLFKMEMFKAEWKNIDTPQNDDSVGDYKFNSFMDKICKKCVGAKKDEKVYRILYNEYGLTQGLLDAIIKDTRLNKGNGVQKGVKETVEKMLKPKKQVKKSQEFGNLFANSEVNFTNQQTKGLPKLICLKGLSDNVIRQIEQKWEYTGSQHINDRSEHIRHFINLCKKEGLRGNSIGPTPLTGVFTEELSKQVEQELKHYYDI